MSYVIALPGQPWLWVSEFGTWTDDLDRAALYETRQKAEDDATDGEIDIGEIVMTYEEAQVVALAQNL